MNGIVITSIALILWGCASTIQSQSQKILANKNAIAADLYNLGADAYQFKIRPSSMGGGNGAYDGSTGGVACSIQFDGPYGVRNPNAAYTISQWAATTITFTGASKTVAASTVTITFDADGKAAAPVYTGQFK